jgi:plasmid stabilization system protein ParE
VTLWCGPAICSFQAASRREAVAVTADRTPEQLPDADRRRLSGTRPDRDDVGELRCRGERPLERRAEDGVDDDVVSIAGLGFRRRGVVPAAKLHDRVRPTGEQALEGRAMPNRGDHPPGAEQLRRLHGDLSWVIVGQRLLEVGVHRDSADLVEHGGAHGDRASSSFVFVAGATPLAQR